MYRAGRTGLDEGGRMEGARGTIDEGTLWSSKVDDIAVFLEHIHLLDGLDRLDIQLLERCL